MIFPIKNGKLQNDFDLNTHRLHNGVFDGKLSDSILSSLDNLRSLTDFTSIYILDDFTSAMAYGTLLATDSGSWFLYSTGSSPIFHFQVYSSNSNPGTFRMRTGNVSADTVHMLRGHHSDGSGFMRFDTVTNWEVTFIFRLVSTSAVGFVIGLMDNSPLLSASATPGGFYLKYDSSEDGNFNFIQKGASENLQSSGVAANVDFNKLVISSTTVGEIVYRLNDSDPVIINDPSTRPSTTLKMGMSLVTRENDYKYAAIDLFRFLYVGIPAR